MSKRTTADRIFRAAYGDIPNFLTPEILDRGMSPSGDIAWEISTGTGMDRQPIYGVTVVDARSKQPLHDVSQCVDSLDHARQLVRALR